MCTLDVMGYSSEMFYTIPFLVYHKALLKQKSEPVTEISQRIFSQIEETCFNIIKHSKVFREELFDKIVAFAFQNESLDDEDNVVPSEAGKAHVSTRTADVIKSIKVLSIQFVLLLKAIDT